MKKAFTMMELVVAIAVLVIMMSFSGVIFKYSIEGYRMSSANAEIIQKLQVITGQLNSDLAGLQKNAPVIFWFEKDPADPNIRYDQVMFFSTGDFKSIKLYDKIDGTVGAGLPGSNDIVLSGNTSRIYYGLAKSKDPNEDLMKFPDKLYRKDRILARRQHILYPGIDHFLTVGSSWPDDSNMSTFDDQYNGNPQDVNLCNEILEYDMMSLAQWKKISLPDYNNVNNNIFNTCFGSTAGGTYPVVDIQNTKTLHKLLCQHVGDLKIHFAYEDENGLSEKVIRWYPSVDPEGDGSYSHFDSKNNSDFFGVYFNIPDGAYAAGSNWYPVDDPLVPLVHNTTLNKSFGADLPDAIKFTFTLYDSRGIFTEGKRFTHIVYIGD